MAADGGTRTPRRERRPGSPLSVHVIQDSPEEGRRKGTNGRVSHRRLSCGPPVPRHHHRVLRRSRCTVSRRNGGQVFSFGASRMRQGRRTSQTASSTYLPLFALVLRNSQQGGPAAVTQGIAATGARQESQSREPANGLATCAPALAVKSTSQLPWVRALLTVRGRVNGEERRFESSPPALLRLGPCSNSVQRTAFTLARQQAAGKSRAASRQERGGGGEDGRIPRGRGGGGSKPVWRAVAPAWPFTIAAAAAATTTQYTALSSR